MKELFSQARAALAATLILAAVCGGAYPLVVFGLAQLAFPDKANGSLLIDADGSIRGSALLGQKFTAVRSFHPRPSAAGAGYDAANSGGSNLGPTSRNLRDAIQERIAAYRSREGLAPDEPVPADAVTASASGLDPHISVRNAELQIPRVARARGLPSEEVRALVRQHTTGRDAGIFGEPGVNVVLLNLALDARPRK